MQALRDKHSTYQSCPCDAHPSLGRPHAQLRQAWSEMGGELIQHVQRVDVVNVVCDLGKAQRNRRMQ